MDYTLLSSEDIETYKFNIINLMKQSYSISFPKEKNNQQDFEKRIISLKNYINNEQAVVYGAMENNKVIGFIWFFYKIVQDKNIVHVNHFVIDEKYRGAGIGKQLWLRLEQYGTAKKIDEIELMVTKNNYEALKFYEKKDFEVERLIMKKRL